MVIGKETMRRLDTPAKVAGKAVYGIDVKIPGMAIASLAQCPVIGGTPKSYDATAALKVAGVIKVVQISDGVAVLAKDFYAARKGTGCFEDQLGRRTKCKPKQRNCSQVS
jgi:isoquinoline 1-oxidoreductase beta subunit